MPRGSRRCNLDGRPLSPQDQAYVDAFARALEELAGPPWWWQMAGRTVEEYSALTNHEQLAAHRG